MAGQRQFAFNDTATFDENVAEFSAELIALDPRAGPVLAAALLEMVDGEHDKDVLLDALFNAIESEADAGQAAGAGVDAVAAPAPVPAAAHWFLEGVEVEGFRGINNEGSPLALKFKIDSVNSISAPNAVGKSSLYDAVSFVLRGSIEKLERLLQSERAQDYYLNRFHPGGVGTVKLTLRPGNGNPVTLTATRSAAGARTVTATGGVDAQALIAELNREFVLLDGETFRSFIDSKALDRGRDFAGLLGLSRYSALRQQLQTLAQTRAFNTHFEVALHATTKSTAERIVAARKGAIAAAYEELVKEPLVAGTTAADAQARCHKALEGMAVLAPHCAGKKFGEIDIDACVSAVAEAEGGVKKQRLAAVIREQSALTAARKVEPPDASLARLSELAAQRDAALEATAGDMLRQLYRVSEEVMSDPKWPSPSLCPTCDRDDGSSVLDGVRQKLGQYSVVEAATAAVAAEWVGNGWGDLSELEKLMLSADEAPRLKQLSPKGAAGTISTEEAEELATHVGVLRTRAETKAGDQAKERAGLEKELPPSLVLVTAAAETARRLQNAWTELVDAEKQVSDETARESIVKNLKKFLDAASASYATADSSMAAERLKKVEPLCQEIFKKIMFSPVVPALSKPDGSEEIGIRLAEFYGLTDLSAQALLSESYRNAFAVSVYLAAASLYGGAPRFVILDDVTSSFDAGHQHHLIEVIRTQFARPSLPDGPQVIILSHDTLLEKLFNRHSGTAHWHHQRLEGTARTAVLPQSGAVNKVRDTTMTLLQAGRIDDAAPRIRQYLEYTLHEVIDRCRIPVPLDVAFGDDKRTPGEFLSAIEAAVKLNQKAGTLILEPSQIAALQLHSANIIGNYLAHWSTGQTQAFSAPALIGVMQAIDAFPDCFKYEPTPGAAKKFYSSLNKK